jgi:Xaa-Pro aminopeptidase
MHLACQILLGKSASLALAEAVGKDNIIIASNPVNEAKSIKTEAEQEGFRQCHIVGASAIPKSSRRIRLIYSYDNLHAERWCSLDSLFRVARRTALIRGQAIGKRCCG